MDSACPQTDFPADYCNPRRLGLINLVPFIGEIPLRELVYRVLDIPPSMRPLVYDFGQLNLGTEYDYTLQIVKDHVRTFKHTGCIFIIVIPLHADARTPSVAY